MTETANRYWSDRYSSVVAFELGGQAMAIPTDILREILEPNAITRVPAADTLSSGLMNVRGVVIPVAELRPVLSLPVKETSRDSRVLVLEFTVEDTAVTVGLIVDKVHAVIALEPDTVRPSPDVGTPWPTQMMSSVARWDGQYIYVPDIEAIFRTRLDQNSTAGAQSSDEAAYVDQ